jgi:hypothetical protein
VVIDLLSAAGSPPISPDQWVERLDTELNEAKPSVRQADFVALIREAEGTPASVVVVEMQLEIDDDKPKSWAHYITYLAARYDVPVFLIVLTASERVAAWVTEGHAVGPHLRLAPLVLGPLEFKAAIDRGTVVLASPLGAIGAVLRHRIDESFLLRVVEELARSAIEPQSNEHRGHESRENVDDPLLRTLIDVLVGLASLSNRDKLAKILETYRMDIREVIRQHVEQQIRVESEAKGEAKGKAEGEAKGKAEGEAKGKAEGEAKGKAEGEAKGKAESLLTVLGARGIAYGDHDEARIRGASIGELDRWLRAALTADAIARVFADE